MNDEILINLIRKIEDLIPKLSPKIKQLLANDPDFEQLIPNKDLAAFFAISTRTLHSWRKDHGLKAVYLSKRIYYNKNDVVEYVQSNRQ